MSRWWSVCIGLWLVVYVTLVGALALERASPREHPGFVLSPIEGAGRIDTRAGALRVRRLCEAGRCELFVGRGAGFELLASYPAEHVVELDEGAGVRRIGPPRASAPPLRLSWLMLPALLGLGLALALKARRADLSLHEGLLRDARRARVDAAGRLAFDDGSTGRASSTLEGGTVSALRPRIEPEPGGPFRAAPAPRWEVVPGEPRDHLARIARARGRLDVMVWLASGTTLVYLTLLAQVVLAALDGP